MNQCLHEWGGDALGLKITCRKCGAQNPFICDEVGIMTYDGAVYDLAESFLVDVLPQSQRGNLHDLTHQLAQKIQAVIEDYLSDVEDALPDVEVLL